MSNRWRPIVFVVLGITAVVILFVVLRPGGDDEDKTTPPTRTATLSATTTTTTSAASTAPRPPGRTRVTIAVRSGRVIGGIRRATLEHGSRIELYVSSDLADEVHLHGYDISRNVAPGTPARLLFRATTAGRFEVELEDRQLQIAEITVTP